MKLFKNAILVCDETGDNRWARVDDTSDRIWFMDIGLFVHFLALEQLEHDSVTLVIGKPTHRFSAAKKSWTTQISQIAYDILVPDEYIIPDNQIISYTNGVLENMELPVYVQESLLDFQVKFNYEQGVSCNLAYKFNRDIMSVKDTMKIARFKKDVDTAVRFMQSKEKSSSNDGLSLLSDLVKITQSLDINSATAFKLGEITGKLHTILSTRGSVSK